MKRLDWNQGWAYRKLNTGDPLRPITLPYDCMLHENRSDEAEGGCNNGWFEGYDYEFIKEFSCDDARLGITRILEFEGIYRRAEIYVNGEKAAYRPNGYLALTADITKAVKPGINTVRVIARGADMPSARWYTGVGIYRPVWLYEAGERHISLNGVRIRTVSIQPAVVEISLKTVGSGTAEISVMKDAGEIASAQCACDGEGAVRITVPDAKLWSPETPELYQCRVRFEGDETVESFGIRTITWDAAHGLCVNGKREILRGACVHHDNGLLGAVTLPDAEERKIRILKSMGFNAIRSAHNPCSRALLDSCDKLGVMVMDEYEDAWYIRKTKYDYASYVAEWFERDLTSMVEKDYNHPCVALYSLGNEVTESAEEKGIALFKQMRDTLKSLDDTRPVTCGINIGFNQAQAAGHGFYSNERADRNDFKNLGTEEANHRKWMFGPLFTRLNAVLPGCDKATRDIFNASDVAGYNYGILRYRHDRRKYPDRIILGSESFCHDAERFWRIARKDPGVIGDFVWTGFDHLGEVGLGAWEYKDYAPNFVHYKGWLTSGSGRVDITGKPLPEAYYMKAAYGLLKKPVIAVIPPNHNGERHSPSGWKMTNAVSSWAWEGCEGKRAKIQVYGCGAYVELYLNAQRAGRKPLGKRCRAFFTLPWKEGELTAIVFDDQRRELGRSSLRSVEKGTEIRIEPEENVVNPGRLCYVRLRLTDPAGTTRVLSRERLRVTVTGGELLGLGHACPYNDDGYVGVETSTYFGEAMAILKADQPGKMQIHAVCDGCEARAEIIVM